MNKNVFTKSFTSQKWPYNSYWRNLCGQAQKNWVLSKNGLIIAVGRLVRLLEKIFCDKQEKGSSFLKMHDFFQTLKIREQHILKSLEKKKLSINFWPVDTKKKLYFFVGKNFFFRWPGPSALRAIEKKIFPTKKNFCFGSTGQKLIQSFFLFQLFKIFIITNFWEKMLKFVTKKWLNSAAKTTTKLKKKNAPFFLVIFSFKGGDKKKHFHQQQKIGRSCFCMVEW